ncbi:hypothetical protein [Mesorhizobium sp. KR9-304]|uniref:hypothetical protein n=1 Tax=Mesorhizobium sp. KR9-304 TaxID=3156614 RepID=UPI0032B37DD4
MARPVHTPDPALRRQVEAMAGYGIPELGIAKVIGIDPKTLRKHYRSELDLGHVKANSAVAQSLFKKATGDGPQSVTAAIFWAKTRMGWKETIVNEHGGVENNPVRISVVRRIIVSPPDRPAPRTIPHLAVEPE